MPEYLVSMTYTVPATCTVKAASRAEALRIVKADREQVSPQIEWIFGEADRETKPRVDREIGVRDA